MAVEYDFDPHTDAAFLSDADAALSNFLKKTDSERAQLSEPLFNICRDFIELIGLKESVDTLKDVKKPEDWHLKAIARDEPLVEMTDPSEIWKFMHPQRIHLVRSNTNNENSVTVAIICKCDWDEEHEMRIAFQNGIGVGLIG